MQIIQKLGRLPIVLTFPGLALLLVVFGIPIVLLFLTSLSAPDFSLANYSAFLSNSANVGVLLQTIEISVIATIICILIGYPTAYLIVAASKPLRVVLLVLVIIPYLTSFLARTYAWIVILGDSGLINNILLHFGLISSPLQLIFNRMAVYIGMVHIMLPMMILPLVSVMMGIDKSLISAARSMGARPFTAFWRVFIPLSLPGVRSGSLLVFVICLGFYITPAALGGLGDAMLSTFIAAQVQTTFELAGIATSSFVLLAIAVTMLSMVGLDLSGSSDQGTPLRKSWPSRVISVSALNRYLGELSAPSRARRWTAHLYKSGGGNGWSKISGSAFIGLVMTFLLFPEIVVIIMSFSAGAFLEFPPSGLSLQWYRSFFGDPVWYGATQTSIKIGIVVTILSTVFGTLAAYGLSRSDALTRRSVTMMILAPITIPAIVVGVATYLGLIKLGLIGSVTGIVLAHSIGAMGYVVVIVSATMANFDRRLEQAAQSMRAGPLQTFMRVTLPLIRPGIIGGALFAFLHSFDEVVSTSLVSGFSVYTLPLKMWENIRNEVDPTVAAVASLLTLLPVLWLVALYVAWWRSRAADQEALSKATI
ncbi:ABC transporter permease subunit [Rhizobium azibense]|uniref:Putative spermidine/putrescine transport system permease protein n=1 Tax=Rhizobium azibense TaxID=1136135 RepID=A0A4R3RA90_9HYPH|nr:ABC transporter permease subunit [Rhizobium azibense]TCU31314.1 putative spermidine/putrescine transport system permease protein [Rhizobium azibense]